MGSSSPALVPLLVGARIVNWTSTKIQLNLSQMKSLVQLFAALMFVLASAGMVPASEHSHADADAIEDACVTVEFGVGHFLDDDHNTGVHCGSPVLMASVTSPVYSSPFRGQYDRPTNYVGTSLSLTSSLPPPRSLY